MEARGGGAAPWFPSARCSPGSLSFLGGKDPRTPLSPSLHAPGTQIHRGLVSPPAVWAPSVYYLESNICPHRGEGRGNWGGWGGGRKPGSDPRPLPPLEPRASALLGQGRLCEIPEGPGRRGLGAAGERWGLTVSPSVRLPVPQATTLSLESTLPSKGCSTPLWERRNECSPWLPACVGTPWSARHPMPTCRLAQVPATGHAGAPEPAWSSHCTAFPPTGSSSIPPFSLPPPDPDPI